MSLYNHVASKDDLLDGMVDHIFSEIDVAPDDDDNWKTAMRTARHLGPRGSRAAPLGHRSH